MDKVFCVAKEFCQNSGWTLTNLQLQKILYIAQLFSYGLRGSPIFNNSIEAWDYGPVVPEVYHQLKYAGNAPIPSFLFPEEDCTDLKEKEFINKISSMVKGLEGWELVAITHRDGGAWKKTYQPGIKHLIITPQAMKEEYKELWSQKNVKQG